MWIMLSKSFLSIVAAPKQPNVLLVRARKAGDIEQVFPQARVHHTPKKDYPFRAFVRRGSVARAMARQVAAIEYPNFKASVPDPARHDAYSSVWATMLHWQQGGFQRQDPLRNWAINDLPPTDRFDDDPLSAGWQLPE